MKGFKYLLYFFGFIGYGIAFLAFWPVFVFYRCIEKIYVKDITLAVGAYFLQLSWFFGLIYLAFLLTRHL